MYDHHAIRAWARSRNIPVPPRGRLPKRLLDDHARFHAATSQDENPDAPSPERSDLEASKQRLVAAMHSLKGESEWLPELSHALTSVVSSYPVRDTLDQLLDDLGQPSLRSVPVDARVASIIASHSPNYVYEVWEYMLHCESVITMQDLGEVIDSAVASATDLDEDISSWLQTHATLAHMVCMALRTGHPEFVFAKGGGLSNKYDIIDDLVYSVKSQKLLSIWREVELDESLTGPEAAHWMRAWALARGIHLAVEDLDD